jgi:ComF family protein
MKYQRVYELVRPLAELLQAQFDYHWGACRPDALVPVPLHRSRLRQREFDQALGLSHMLSCGLDLPLWADVLVRHRNTTSQVGLKEEARRHNVRGAFRVHAPSRCEGKTLLLIDDVYTTGATVKECARVLRQAGAARIDVYTLARVE